MNESFVAGLAVGFGAAVLLFAALGIGFLIVRPWLRMKMSGGRGTLFHILGMRLRGNPPMLIVDAYTSMLHSGDQVSLRDVESQFVANRAKISSALELIEHVREHERRQKLARKKGGSDK